MLSPITRYLLTQATQSHPLTDASPCRLPQKQSLLTQVKAHGFARLRDTAERNSAGSEVPRPDPDQTRRSGGTAHSGLGFRS